MTLTTRPMPPHARWRAVSAGTLLAALALAIGGAAHADDERGPIVLTNEDVVRIGGRVKPSDDSRPAPRRSADAPAADRDTPADAARQRVADSWQEEYWRLKAEALRRSIERGEPIDEDDDARMAEVDPPPASLDAAPTRSRPTCLYGHRGELIYSPAGMRCRENRQLDASSRDETRGSREHASCLYGLQGELLHEPYGRTCPRRRGLR